MTFKKWGDWKNVGIGSFDYTTILIQVRTRSDGLKEFRTTPVCPKFATLDHKTAINLSALEDTIK